METKQLKDLKVSDVLAMSEYMDALEEEMKRMARNILQNDTGIMGRRYNRMLRSFINRGIWKVDMLRSIYYEIINKTARGLSSTERALIQIVCFSAYADVIDILKAKENEGKTDKRNGNN